MGDESAWEPKVKDEMVTVAGQRREDPGAFLWVGLIQIAMGILAFTLTATTGIPIDKLAAMVLGVTGAALLFHALSARGSA